MAVDKIPSSLSAASSHSGHSAGSTNRSPEAASFQAAIQAAQSQRRLPLTPPSEATQAGIGAATYPAANGVTVSSHIPLGGQGRVHNIQEQALNLHAYRLQLIASNIANADTPNYKAIDFDFREALRNAVSSNPQQHSERVFGPGSVSLKYYVPQEGSVDGNTVELDVERAKFAESALRYEFSLNRVSGHYKMIMELLTNLKD
ncbi:hypothetical protein GCM10027343_24020 [Noviherbaspirillum agri]